MLATANAAAANWTVVADISLRETYTDNVILGAGSRTDDFITEITPGIRVDGRSPRLAASLTYRPSALLYARESDFNDVVNNLAASGRLEAVEKFFFIDAAASITQNFISPFAPQPRDVTTVTPNRLESRTLSLSPSVRGQLGGSLEYELRNSHTWTNTDSDALGDVYTRRWSGRIAGPMRLLGWAVEYDDSKIEHEDFTGRPDQKSWILRSRLYYQPDVSWRFSLSSGGERNNYVLQRTQSEAIYGAGVSWRPGPRTSAELEYEHRFFGPARLARFAHRTRLTAWNISYSRDTSTFQDEVLRIPPGNTAALLDSIFAARIPDPNQRRIAVEEFLRSSGPPAFLASSLAFYTQRIYLREGVEASAAVLGVRNSITFTGFYSENSRISADALVAVPDPFLLANRFTQRGFGVRADHRLTPFTTVGASANRVFTRQDEPPGPDTGNDYFTLTLNHTVSPKTTTFAGASITRFDSEDAASSSADASSIFVGLHHRF